MFIFLSKMFFPIPKNPASVAAGNSTCWLIENKDMDAIFLYLCPSYLN